MGLLLGADPAATGLCHAPEHTLFDCATAKGGRRISLCGESGRVVYRFGTTSHVEMEYPAAGVAAKDAFRFQKQPAGFRPEDGMARVLLFENGGARYELFAQPEADDPPMFAGVVAIDAAGKRRVIACSSAAPEALAGLSGMGLPLPPAAPKLDGKFRAISFDAPGISTWSTEDASHLKDQPVLLGAKASLGGKDCSADPASPLRPSLVMSSRRQCEAKGDADCNEFFDEAAKCAPFADPRSLSSYGLQCGEHPFTVYALSSSAALATSEGATFCLHRAAK